LPGTSILNQLERILSITGRPTANDLASVKSEQAKNMIDQINHVKVQELKELFGSGHDQLIDLISKLLQFNPSKRLTASEALQHPYLADFTNKKDEI
jgi:mitogen-activated protein kinase 15